MPVSELLIRIPVSFFMLYVVVRLLGKEEISQLTFFHFTSAIAFGSIAANMAFNKHLSIHNGIFVLVGWSILTVGMELISLKSKKARRIIEGEPVILIKQGRVMEKALGNVRLDMSGLKALLREKGIFSLSDVDYAIFETDGNLSVLKKSNTENIHTNKDSILPLATEVVSQGKIHYQNLRKLNRDEDWLHQELQENGVKSISDVFYAEVQQDGSLYLDIMDDRESTAKD
ncbi:DUF421 domain-containing protein [Peribacillus sp. SCS-155]|uniref:DUF421 domain-containing protein n=1 Tax=Peribacillus sedimenti TaxID=3115297 RepID=UPI003905C1CB